MELATCFHRYKDVIQCNFGRFFIISILKNCLVNFISVTAESYNWRSNIELGQSQ